jgi:PIN domain nuclease of toxin-antitoxin system
MRLLLDTHVFLWWDGDLQRLSPAARAAFDDRGNVLLLSVASVWEMQIKLQLGKLKLLIPLARIVEEQQRANGLEVLPVTLRHVLALEALPLVHKDPFDRLLLAQASAEEATLVSADSIFASYPVKLLW